MGKGALGSFVHIKMNHLPSNLMSWLVMLDSNSGKLARIEFLVVFTTIVLSIMFSLDFHRHQCRHGVVRCTLVLLDTIVDSFVSYTLGLMQLVPFENEMFQVWALLLIILKNNIRYISAYSLQDKDNRRKKEMRDLLDSFLVANLIATRGTRFKVPLWVLWGLNVLKIMHSIWAFDLADRSYAQGRNTTLVDGYMQYEYKLSNNSESTSNNNNNNNKCKCKSSSSDDDNNMSNSGNNNNTSSKGKVPLCAHWADSQLEIAHSICGSWSKSNNDNSSSSNNSNNSSSGNNNNSSSSSSNNNNKNKNNKMGNYKYLVFGEAEQEVIPELPRYDMRLSAIHEKKLITIDKIWECKGSLLSADKSNSQEAERRRDICLAFALYKLLRRRFEGLDDRLQDQEREKNKEMFVQILFDNNTERLFRIVRKELAFLNDYLYTRFPIVFASGFPHIYLVYFGVSGIGCWLAAELLIDYKVPTNDLQHIEGGHNIGVIITFVVIVLMRLGEWWEMITYIFSDWSKVMMLCKYVEKTSWHDNTVAKTLLGFLCNHTVTIGRNRRLGQYRFLKSFKYNPWITNLLSQVSFGMIAKVQQGAEKEFGELTCEAKDAIVNSLRKMLDKSASHADHCSGNGIEMLKENVKGMSSRTILVWHIATAVCEIHRTLNPISNEEKELSLIRKKKTAATNLSDYCAYLLACTPELLPDHSFTKENIFKDTVEKARKLLQDCKDDEEIYKKMKELHQSYSNTMKAYNSVKPIPEDETTVSNDETPTAKKASMMEDTNCVVDQGAWLAFELIEKFDGTGKDVENPAAQPIQAELERWKMLEEFWAAFILYLAPSDNIDAHSLKLNKGGEFMTQLWALLYHVGVLHPPCRAQNKVEKKMTTTTMTMGKLIIDPTFHDGELDLKSTDPCSSGTRNTNTK